MVTTTTTTTMVINYAINLVIIPIMEVNNSKHN